MFQPKTVVRFALVLVLVFLPLWVYAPFFQAVYAKWFRVVGNGWFSSQFWFWSEARTHFLDNTSPTLVTDINKLIPGDLPDDFKNLKALTKLGERDTLLVMLNRNVPAVPGFTRTSSHVMGYAPTVMVVALAVATPIAWRRRAWLLGLSLMFVHGLIVLRLTIVMLKNGFAEEKRFALFHPGKFWWDVLRRLDEVFADEPTVAYLLAIVPWILALVVVVAYPTLHKKMFEVKRAKRPRP